MKQRKLVREVDKACIEHNTKRQTELRLKEFAKIVQRKAQGRTFTNQWTAVQV
jgi:hypothetical protein